MRAWTLALFIVVLTGAAAFLAVGCGETNPAQAPQGSSIVFVTEEGEAESYTLALEYSVNETYNVIAACTDVFEKNMIALCTQQAYFTDHAGATADEAATQCQSRLVWGEYVNRIVGSADATSESSTANTYGRAARESIELGDCGYWEQIISAFVTRSSDSTGSTTSSSAEPMNGVEVRWITNGQGLELYEVGDIPGEISPLANPFFDETNDRGITELKLRFPAPVLPNLTYDLSLTADIGVDLALYKFTITTGSIDTTAGDDDTGDDDTGA